MHAPDIKCPYCGRENEEGAAHCRECGTELELLHSGSAPRLRSYSHTLALFLRVTLGIVAVLQLVLFVVLSVIGEILGVILHGGFHVGPPPKPLYSAMWGDGLWLFWIFLSLYHLTVAMGVWGRSSFRFGVSLHLGFGTYVVLCMVFTGIHESVYIPLFVSPAIWSFYAIRFRPSELAA